MRASNERMDVSEGLARLVRTVGSGGVVAGTGEEAKAASGSASGTGSVREGISPGSL